MSETKRVVFDLDETLIESGPPGAGIDSRWISLRPGAEDLLRQLRDNGLDLILWTTAGQGWVDRVFRQFPDLQANFPEIITAEDADRLLNPLKNEADKFSKDDPRRWCLENLAEYHSGGGKYPPAVEAKYLVDDTNAAAHTASVMGTFEHIFPNSKESDPSPDEWAKRVAQALLGK